MSVSADHIRIFVEAGLSTDELILFAEAMECGEDYRSISGVITALRETNATSEQIATVVTVMADEIVRNRRSFWSRKPDEHTAKRDSNKSRRRLSNDRWQELRLQTFERDGHACVYCGSTEDLTCDHVVPLVRGGTNDNDNLATACRPCNSSKSDKLLSEWRR